MPDKEVNGMVPAHQNSNQSAIAVQEPQTPRRLRHYLRNRREAVTEGGILLLETRETIFHCDYKLFNILPRILLSVLFK